MFWIACELIYELWCLWVVLIDWFRAVVAVFGYLVGCLCMWLLLVLFVVDCAAGFVLVCWCCAGVCGCGTLWVLLG